MDWNGYMLPDGLRDLLGMPAPEPTPVITPAEVLVPPPVVQEPAPIVQNAPDFAAAPPAKPLEGKALAKANAAYAKKSAAQRDAEAVSAPLRMPTLAQTTAEQQAATGDAANAIASDTAVQQKQADEVYRAQLGAQAALEQNDRALAEQQAKSDRVRADKQATALALMAQADATKVDMGRYWKDAPTGKKVGWLLAMAMSGLGEVLQGKSGPNPVIGMLERTIDADVRQQEMNRAAIKERAQRAEGDVDAWDRFSANQEARILARRAQAKELVAQQLAIATAKYGSEQALANGQKAMAELRSSSAKDIAQAVDMAFGHEMQREGLKNQRAQVAQGWSRIALDKQQFAEGVRQFDARMSMESRQLDLEAQKLEQAGRTAEAKAKREQAEKQNELGMLAPAAPVVDAKGEAVLGPDGTPQIRRDSLLKNQDGTPWMAPKAEVRTELAKKMAAATEVTGIIDEVLAIRDRVGGESSWGNSDDYQRLKVLQNRLQLLQKSGTQGMSSDADMAAIRDALGAGDITSFRDKAAGLEEGRRRTEDELNTSMKYLGNYSGERITFPRKDRSIGLTNEDDLFKEAVKGDAYEQEQAARSRFGARAVERRDAPEAEREASLKQYIRDVETAGINASAKKLLTSAASTLANPKATSEAKSKARQQLHNLADEARNKATREAARGALLIDIQRSIGAPTPVNVPFADVYTSKEP